MGCSIYIKECTIYVLSSLQYITMATASGHTAVYTETYFFGIHFHCSFKCFFFSPPYLLFYLSILSPSCFFLSPHPLHLLFLHSILSPPLGLFRHFTTFMNMVHSMNGIEVEKMGQLRKHTVFRHVSALREATIVAMSNMLTANIDSGLTHAIGKHMYT